MGPRNEQHQHGGAKVSPDQSETLLEVLKDIRDHMRWIGKELALMNAFEFRVASMEAEVSHDGLCDDLEEAIAKLTDRDL